MMKINIPKEIADGTLRRYQQRCREIEKGNTKHAHGLDSSMLFYVIWYLLPATLRATHKLSMESDALMFSGIIRLRLIPRNPEKYREEEILVNCENWWEGKAYFNISQDCLRKDEA